MIFFRKKSITSMMRASIGVAAIMNSGVYGAIQELANKYKVSRPFIYLQKNIILEAFSVDLKKKKRQDVFENKEIIQKLILALKFCCKSSHEGISETLKMLGYKYNSIGFISQFLSGISEKIVDELPAVDDFRSILADEIFVCGQPILVIQDALSHTVLAIELAKDRTGETWNKCFLSLIEKGYKVNVVAKDLGTGLAKGVELMNENENINVVSQADLFHLLAKFNSPLTSLEAKAYSSIANEEKRIEILKNRKSEKTELKATEAAVDAIDECEGRIDQYDDYNYLRYELHEAFNPFNKDGTFRNKTTIKGDVTAILDLLEESFSDNNKIIRAVKFLRKNIDGYFPYIAEIKKALDKYRELLPHYLIKEICLAYQKGLKSIAIKNYQLSKKIAEEAKEHSALAQLVTETESEKNATEGLSAHLNKAVRSSSALEAKNSVLREYINASSGQITQKHLNLIAFYLNRKVSHRGKYKGKSPIERLTGIKTEENFINILLTI